MYAPMLNLPRLVVQGLSVGLFLSLFAAACSGGGQSTSDATVSRLRACKLVTEGDIRLTGDDDVEEDPVASCLYRCLLDQSCDKIERLFCPDPSSTETLDEETLFTPACVDLCVPKFNCGNGKKISELDRCNDVNDCGNWADEPESCGMHRCADGTFISEAFVCDGNRDCSDGADEQNCPDLFVCDSGNTSLPISEKCDGYASCEDGSDEANCPSYTCNDGEQLARAARCNLTPDCHDGSDEANGCARFTCNAPTDVLADMFGAHARR